MVTLRWQLKASYVVGKDNWLDQANTFKNNCFVLVVHL